MPQGETFWNPYRWVTVGDQPVKRDGPRYHHTSSGLSGRLWCELEALTPLIIGDGRGQFVRHQHNERPYIPATSLKGAMRSLAEVVGNAAVPFPKVSVDAQHALAQARKNSHLDTVARTFGYLDASHVFAGLIRFSDAEIAQEVMPPHQWRQYEVVVGQPKRSHGAFYLQKNQRKFYHHHPGSQQLVAPPPNIKQTANIRPAPPGTRFSFTVDFANLREAELSLLLYCLVLEEDVTIKLSAAALGPNAQELGTLHGPLRHKIGGAKPHGAGSVHVSIAKMELRTDAMVRYRGSDHVETWEAEALSGELDRRTASFRERADQTMRELRAMLIYSTEDPRKPIRYPQFGWFQNTSNSSRKLKPTI